MKHIFSLLQLFISLETVFSYKFILNRMAKAMLTMKNIKEYKDAKRKLEESIDEQSDYAPEANGTDKNKTDSPPFDVSPDTPVANNPKITNNTYSKLQIKKFHNFETKEKKIVFNVLVYFFNRLIARIIKTRVRIVYTGRIRSLDDQGTAESSPTTCEISEQYAEKVGKNGYVENIDYNCSAPTSYDLRIKNVTLNTDYNLLVDNESVNFT